MMANLANSTFFFRFPAAPLVCHLSYAIIASTTIITEVAISFFVPSQA